MLAQRDYAPKFYGHCSPDYEHNPKAYAMQLLDFPPWRTLFELLELPVDTTGLEAIRKSLHDILGILEEGGKVHGDLRPVNIMHQQNPTLLFMS